MTEFGKYPGTKMPSTWWDEHVDHAHITPEASQIYKAGSYYKARRSTEIDATKLSGTILEKDTDAATVIQAAMDEAVSGSSLGHVTLHGTVFEIGTALDYKAPLVGVKGHYDDGSPSYNRRMAAVLKATADITVLTVDGHTYSNNTRHPVVKDIEIDCNNTASKALYVKDSWLGEYKLRIRDVPSNGIGIHVTNKHTDDYGCYYNKFWAYIDGVSKASGSIGIKTEKEGGTATPNFNLFTGRVTDLAEGVYLQEGAQQVFSHFDAVGNTRGYYINTTNNVFFHCIEEDNTNNPTLTKDGSATIIQGYWEAVPYPDSDASKTGTLVIINDDGLELFSKYNAGGNHATPRVRFAQSGNQDWREYANNSGKIFDFDGMPEYVMHEDYMDFKGNYLKDVQNEADGTLSGTPKLFIIYDGGTKYYVRGYPIKT